MRYLVTGTLVLTAVLGSAPVFAQERALLIANATTAAPTSITENATVMDWKGNTLRAGSNGWVCFPDPPGMEAAPMCVDGPWQAWAGAWQNRTAVDIERAGIAYMLMGDAGASNIDPHAAGATPDNDWVKSGPHLMLIVPDLADLEGFPTDPEDGGPWVMWKGTPYAHVMIPVPGHR